MSSNEKIVDRIVSDIGDVNLIDKLLSLPKSDLSSLFIEIYRKQSNSITPVDIVKSFQNNRFTIPSEIDPAIYHNFEADILTLAQDNGLKAILLSPAAPFAGCSSFGYVNQNNVVSATRANEILSDPTNVLSIIIASQLKDKSADNKKPLHYCTTSRVLRAQVFPKQKGYYSHFGIFCIVSSGKDSGSYACEKSLLMSQLTYYRKLLINKLDANLSVALRKRHGYADGEGFYEQMADMVKSEFPGVPVSLNPEYEENNYYKGIHFTIYMEKEHERVEVGDGGFVDWTQQMTGNKKERCLISGIGLDRLLI